MSHRKDWIILLVGVLFAPLTGQAESWAPFCDLIEESDYIAQYQELVRDEKQIVGRRLVRVYWQANDFKLPRNIGSQTKPWPLTDWTIFDYKPATDRLVTKFVFHGRGQHLVTLAPHRGVVRYPGSTAEFVTIQEARVDNHELACSSIEFHDILVEAGRLKKAGGKIKGALELTVFGKTGNTEKQPTEAPGNPQSLKKVLRNKTFAEWIAQVTKGPTLEDRHNALQVLRNDGLTHDRTTTLRVFAEALSDKVPTVVALAATGLRVAGKPTDPKAPAKLVELVSIDLSNAKPPAVKPGEARELDGQFAVAFSAIRTLEVIGSDKALPALRRIAEDKKVHKALRQLAAKAVTKIQADNKTKGVNP